MLQRTGQVMDSTRRHRKLLEISLSIGIINGRGSDGGSASYSHKNLYTSLVLACTPEDMRARALAGVHAGEHAVLKLKTTNLDKTPRSHNRTRPISGRWRHRKIQDEL